MVFDGWWEWLLVDVSQRFTVQYKGIPMSNGFRRTLVERRRSWIFLNNPCHILAGVCVCQHGPGFYQFLAVNRTQLHAVTPKQLLLSCEQSSEKNISDISGHCVLSYPRASFLRPEKFTGWLRGMCSLPGKKTEKKTLWHFTLGKWTFSILRGKETAFALFWNSVDCCCCF